MKKIPKQEYTPEFRELAVNRVTAGQTPAAVARELGLMRENGIRARHKRRYKATTDIVTEALTMVWFRRKPAPGVLHHPDRGGQYASRVFQNKLMISPFTHPNRYQDNSWHEDKRVIAKSGLLSQLADCPTACLANGAVSVWVTAEKAG